MLSPIQNQLKKIPSIFRNVFFLTTVAFAVWMFFFDENNLLLQYKRRCELNDLHEKINFVKQEIKSTESEYDLLLTDKTYQEKFARENYLMKRDNEDVYVIIK